MHSGDLLDHHTLFRLPAIGFYLPLYVSKYHARRDDALPGGVFCDGPIYLLSRVPNTFESVVSSTNLAANKNACPWLWSIFEK